MNDMPEELRQLIGAQMRREPVVEPDVSTQIGVLRDIGARYGQGLFKVGDLVAARAGHNLTNVGRPSLVIEVIPYAQVQPRFETKMPGTPHDGAMYDMRVVVWMNGDYDPYWVESWQYEPYVGGDVGEGGQQ